MTAHPVALFRWLACLLWILFLPGCHSPEGNKQAGTGLKVSRNHRFLETDAGEPFLWIGGTTWGMPEWLDREGVDAYLDQRKGIGFNVVQICLFWGKRVDDPTDFSVNPPDAYGFKAFHEVNGKPDTSRPLVREGGSPENPNDYWDHVDYIVRAAGDRGMRLAILPVWGRRYVNAYHGDFSHEAFSVDTMFTYGDFLGRRYGDEKHLIWVMGGDVQATANGDYRGYYRSMAEGLIKGATGESVSWGEASPLWDKLLMTYHPDGTPMENSSTWFHEDPWLDFNMVETYRFNDSVYTAIQHDYNLEDPVKPTVMGEPSYENYYDRKYDSKALEMRQQAYHSFFAGAAGFTYGAFRDAEGNGPLFSPFMGWRKLLDLEGAHDMQHVRTLCLDHGWPGWIPVHDLVTANPGTGELTKAAVRTDGGDYLVYFPDNSPAVLGLPGTGSVRTRWFRTTDGFYSGISEQQVDEGSLATAPPEGWTDAVLILSGTGNPD